MSGIAEDRKGIASMKAGHDQVLCELVDFSDLAVRTASQLRLAEAGKALSDPEAVERAVGFLTRARDAGLFLIGRPGPIEHSLRPLNWATDAYVQLIAQPPDYEKVAAYLDAILSALKDVAEHPVAPPAEAVRRSSEFFDKLATLLAAEADKLLIEVSEPSRF